MLLKSLRLDKNGRRFPEILNASSLAEHFWLEFHSLFLMIPSTLSSEPIMNDIFVVTMRHKTTLSWFQKKYTLCYFDMINGCQSRHIKPKLICLGPLLLTWFNFNPSMDK